MLTIKEVELDARRSKDSPLSPFAASLFWRAIATERSILSQKLGVSQCRPLQVGFNATQQKQCRPCMSIPIVLL